MGRELRALGFVKISARPRHQGQNEFVIEDFKKTFPPSWQKSAVGSRPTSR
ncbi:MAG: winged helix-turn-helix domain-containing protein [Rhodospirillales bacterium]